MADFFGDFSCQCKRVQPRVCRDFPFFFSVLDPSNSAFKVNGRSMYFRVDTPHGHPIILAASPQNHLSKQPPDACTRVLSCTAVAESLQLQGTSFPEHESPGTKISSRDVDIPKRHSIFKATTRGLGSHAKGSDWPW